MDFLLFLSYKCVNVGSLTTAVIFGYLKPARDTLHTVVHNKKGCTADFLLNRAQWNWPVWHLQSGSTTVPYSRNWCLDYDFLERIVIEISIIIITNAVNVLTRLLRVSVRLACDVIDRKRLKIGDKRYLSDNNWVLGIGWTIFLFNC